MINRRQKAFSAEDTKALAQKFHAFRAGEDVDELGAFYGATTDEIAKQDYILTPGRYVGVAEEEDDGVPFEQKMATMTATLKKQFIESARLEEEIRKNLSILGYDI